VPQKLLMVIDHLSAIGLLSTAQLVAWALRPPDGSGSGSRSDGPGSAWVPNSGAWEALYYGLSRSFSRKPQISEQVRGWGGRATFDHIQGVPPIVPYFGGVRGLPS
jgi:hypothetical protein